VTNKNKNFSFRHLLPGVYAPGDSVLHKASISRKIFFGLGLLVLAAFGRWWGIAVVSLACLFGLYLAGIDFSKVCQRLRTFAWFILFLGIFPVFFTPGSPIEISNGHSLGLTWEGLEAGALFSCRMTLMFLISMIFMHTTEPTDLFALQETGGEGGKGLQTFFREAGTVGLMAFQLLPILSYEVEKWLVVELNEKKISGSLFNKTRQVAHLLIPLTVSVFENTDQYSKRLNNADSRPETGDR
jgi:energy-coupling factor transporter transmembrane protein EcfT